MLKKLFAGAVSIAAALFAVCAITVCAGAETSEDYEYRVLDDGTVEITSYTGSAAELEIPSTLGGKKVTYIDSRAFAGCTSLTSVTIPDSVTRIGAEAFADCTSLISITIPDSVTSIGENAFNGCTNLTSVTIPDGVTSIEANAFAGCTNLTSVTIPDGVTSIGDEAFLGCTNLTSVTIPDTVTSIGKAAFRDCTSLSSIILPGSVTSIGDDAFRNCTSLTSIAIPDGVTSIGYGVFSYCSALASVTLPDSATDIGDYAFYHCSELTEIKIPDGVKSIGYCAFGYCSALASVTLPDSVTDIGELAFYNCAELTEIKIPDGVTSIGNSTFADCSKLTSINIPDGVISIGEMVFDGCEGLTSITIPDGVTSIGYAAFPYCTNLTYIIIPDSVTSIGDQVFHGSLKLKDVYFTGSKAKWDTIAIGEDNEELFSATVHYEHIAPSAITGLKLAARTSSSLRLSWDKNASADGYIIEMKDGDTWKRVGKLKANTAVVFNKYQLKAGTAYTFRIMAYKMSGKIALYSGYKTISARTDPTAITGLKLAARTSSSLRLSWDKNTSADGYIIEMKDGDTWKRVGKLKDNTATVFNKYQLKAGTAYTFRVMSYKMSGKTALYSGYKTISARTDPTAISGLKLKTSTKSSVRLAWTKNTSADGYIIEMKDGGTWKRVGKLKANTSTVFNKYQLKAGTTYTFRIMAYKMSGKTALYSGYKTITVKTK